MGSPGIAWHHLGSPGATSNQNLPGQPAPNQRPPRFNQRPPGSTSDQVQPEACKGQPATARATQHMPPVQPATARVHPAPTSRDQPTSNTVQPAPAKVQPTWELSLEIFRLGTIAWDFRLGSFTWELSFGNCCLITCDWHLLFGLFCLELSFGHSGVINCAREVAPRTIRLGISFQDISFGHFRLTTHGKGRVETVRMETCFLGSLAWERSLRQIRLGTFVLAASLGNCLLVFLFT